MSSRRVVGLTAAAVLALSLLPATAWAGGSHVRCVGGRTGCYPTLRAAIAAAGTGDTIDIDAGRYAGGVTITKSLHLVGAGATSTTIAGGGPVLTIGSGAGGSVPTVTVSDLALTGGVATGNGLLGFGGGLYIPPTADNESGATVTLTHVWVHDNRATATRTTDSLKGATCPQGDCPFAFGAGGGIFNAGHLTVVGSYIGNNVVDGRLSDADGGGIYSEIGSLTLRSSTVADNHARPQAIGRFAEGGGVFVNDDSAVDIVDSTIARNAADLVTSWPVLGQGVLIDMNANSGGVHIGDGVQAAISGSRIVGNSISAVDPIGEPYAFDSAMLVGISTITVDHTAFDGNHGYADTATDADVGFSGTAVEFDATAHVSHATIDGNTATSMSPTGPAGVAGGLAVFNFSGDPSQVTVSDTTINGNQSFAYSKAGGAAGTGGGVINNSLLTLDRVSVSRNLVHVSGPDATAQGGGIWNGPLLSGPPVTLILSASSITGNCVAAAAGGTSQGGGLYTTVPFTRTSTAIAGNNPDNLYQDAG